MVTKVSLHVGKSLQTRVSTFYTSMYVYKIIFGPMCEERYEGVNYLLSYLLQNGLC